MIRGLNWDVQFVDVLLAELAQFVQFVLAKVTLERLSLQELATLECIKTILSKAIMRILDD